MLKIRLTFILGISIWLPQLVETIHGAGVTIITHGFNGNVTDWIIPMADQMVNYTNFPGTNYACYVMTVDSNGNVGQFRIGGVSPALSDSGEILIKLDWSALADDPFTSTTDIADSVVPQILSPTFIPELAGASLAELPIHLIGHSRGGSAISEMARLLGMQGVWVDQVTTLDPHPVGSYSDADVEVFLNVLYADNYWQTNPDVFCPNGESIFGAYNRYLADLDGGYSCNHSDVHLWYHGTIDLGTPATDTQATITSLERQTWWSGYEAEGLFAGFYYSLIGGGDRLSVDEPAGTGTGRIRDGYNQAWDFGAGQTGNRTLLPSNNGNWPNVIKFNLVSPNAAHQGTNILVKYFYQWAQTNTSTATLSFYLDDDFNPLNGNSRLLQQGTVPGNGALNVGYETRSLALNATNAPVGNHVLYAKITGGGKTRYLYAPEILTVLPPPDTTPPRVSITNPPTAKTYTNAQTVTISANATDNVNVASVSFYDGPTLIATDTTAAYTYDWALTASDNGVHVWTARAYDSAGNVATSAPVTLTVSIDVTPPTVTITAPTNGQVYTTALLTVVGTAADAGSPSSGLSTVEVRTNGGSWLLASGTASWSRSVTLSPCANLIEARSRDKAGNYSAIASTTASYTPPNTPPTVPSNISPPNGATVSLTPTLQASVFADLDCTSDMHAASQWQVLNSPGTVIVWDSGTNATAKTSIIVSSGKLAYASNYLWHVRYEDTRGAWSTYSASTGFKTAAPGLIATMQGTNILLQWPTNALGFTLQAKTNLISTNWVAVTPLPVLANGQYAVTNSVTNQFRFYRLKR